MAGDTLTVSGLCWDVTTGVDLMTEVTAWENGKKRKIGQSNPSGSFTLRLPGSIQALSFDVKGYPTTTVPVNRGGKIDSSARFSIVLPMISPDSQQVTRAYQPVDGPADQPARFSRKAKRVYFRVQNARTFGRLPATICFTYPRSGRTQCVEVDSTKVPSFILLEPGERITFEVRAREYQPYRGELIVGQSGAELHQIKLLPPNNVLITSHDLPADLKLAQYEVLNANNESQVWGTKVHPFRFSNLKPGEDYQFIATAENGQVVADETFRMEPGFTFVQFHLIPPGSSRLSAKASAKPAYFDSTVLYFDQSDYLLRHEAKRKLDSISWQLIKLRQVTAQVTGHTDNVGRRNLNLTLAEYRTRVVGTYLQQKGVSASQLSSSWKGPDTPAVPNDTEKNKAKNRRVVIRFFTKK